VVNTPNTDIDVRDVPVHVNRVRILNTEDSAGICLVEAWSIVAERNCQHKIPASFKRTNRIIAKRIRMTVARYAW
jgi:hypothetical protein